MEHRAFPGVDGTFVHPFDDDDFVAGNATMGLEIVEDPPAVETVITAIGGGGLVTGVASGVRARKPNVRSTVPSRRLRRRARSRSRAAKPPFFRNGRRRSLTAPAERASFRGLGTNTARLDGSIVVTLDETRRAMRLLAEKARVIAEGAGALSVAAALRSKDLKGPIVAVVSDGNIDLAKFFELIAAE